jgi:O-antigen ligase
MRLWSERVYAVIDRQVVLIVLLVLLSFTYLVGLSEIYRFFGYLAVLVALVLLCKAQALRSEPDMVLMLAIPVLLVLIHMVATGTVAFTKPIRHLLVAVALAYLIYRYMVTTNYAASKIASVLIYVIGIYIFVQYLWMYGFQYPYGTTKNPHYLAQGCMLLLFLMGYLWRNLNSLQRLFVVLQGATLLWLLIRTQSRPAWLGLLLGLVVLFLFLPPRQKFVLLAGFSSIIGLLFITDLGNFTDRVMDLYRNITTEERIVIWQNMWQMLCSGSSVQWLIGHGMDSFFENFKNFSEYHRHGINYNSPHNFFLELLYIHGYLGLSVTIIFFMLLYSRLIRLYRLGIHPDLCVFILVMLTANLFFSSITLPFYTAYNLNVIAIAIGAMIALNSYTKRVKFSEV